MRKRGKGAGALCGYVRVYVVYMLRISAALAISNENDFWIKNESSVFIRESIH